MFDWVHYHFPSRLFFEMDSTHKIGSMVRDLGKRVLIVTVREENTNPDQLAVIKTSLEKYTSGCIIYDDFSPNPIHEEIDTAAHFTKQCNADIIMAYGARNSLSAAKAIALLARNEIFANDLRNSSFPLKKKALPLVTVPTYPAMGEECTPSFYIHEPETKTNFYAQDPNLYPELIFLDPNITLGISSNEMANYGAAALSACIEAILSKKANEISNSIALRGIELIARNLMSLVNEPNNHAARMGVFMSSVFAGMAHSNSRLGLTYSIASAAVNLTNLDFYRVNSILLPHIMEYNLTTSAGKYVQIARALEEDIADITVIEAAIKAVEGVRKLFMELKLPQRLSDFEIEKSELPAIADQAYNIPMTRNTPREMDKNEIETILIAAY